MHERSCTGLYRSASNANVRKRAHYHGVRSGAQGRFDATIMSAAEHGQTYWPNSAFAPERRSR
jgi:hypothetical protein